MEGLVICVNRGTAVQLMLPLFGSPPGLSVVECFMELLKCEKPTAAEPIGSGLHNSFRLGLPLFGVVSATG